MILPGTLVQYLGNDQPGSAERCGVLRRNGIYTCTGSRDIGLHLHPDDSRCLALVIELAEATPTLGCSTFCFCTFRILAKPLSVEDQLDAREPSDGGAKQPSTPSPKIKVPGSSS